MALHHTGCRNVTYVPANPFDKSTTIDQPLVKAETTIELYNGAFST